MENAITTEYDYSKEKRGVFFLIDSKVSTPVLKMLSEALIH